MTSLVGLKVSPPPPVVNVIAYIDSVLHSKESVSVTAGGFSPPCKPPKKKGFCHAAAS